MEEIPQRMRAAVLTNHGGPEVLIVSDDVEVPRPGPAEVLVRVSAAAVNNTDIWTREGAYGTAEDPDGVAGWRGVPLDFPRIQGGDVAGRVVAGGERVEPERVGQRVIVDPAFADEGGDIVEVLGSERDGGFAQYVAVPSDHAHDVAGSPLGDAQLACLPIAYGTAMGMLERAEVTAGEVVLVTGASGGVGTALVQLATAREATVIAVTSSGHEQAVLDAGAAATVTRDGGDVADQLRALGHDRVDAVADVVGGPMFRSVFDLLRTGGRLVTAGAIAGPVVRLDLRQLYLRQRRLIGSTMHTTEQFALLTEQAVRGQVDPPVARTYPLAEIHTAQRDFLTGDFDGKLVVQP